MAILAQNTAVQDNQNASKYPAPADNTVSIFDDMQPLPVYYSQTAVYVFSILFGALFGAVLMAMNLHRTPARKGIWQVVAVGAGLTILQLWLMYTAPQRSNTSSALFGSIAGGLAIRYFFWPKYIGASTAYSKRPIWAPLVTGCILTGIYLYAVL